MRVPPGIFIFEDPPVHTMHRGVLSRVFTPKTMAALEPQVRRVLRPQASTRSSAADGFDFVRDLGARDADARDRHAPRASPRPTRRRSATGSTRACATEPGKPSDTRRSTVDGEESSPSTSTGASTTRPTTHDRADQRRVRGRDRHDPPAHPRGDPGLRRTSSPAAGQRDDQPADRLDGQGARRSPRPARGSCVDDPSLDPERDRGDAALRAAGDSTSRGTWPATSSSTGEIVPAGSAMLLPRRRRRTATSDASPTPTASTSTARSATTSRSGTAPTSASAPRSRASRAGSRSRRCCKRFPDWEVDWDHAKLAARRRCAAGRRCRPWSNNVRQRREVPATARHVQATRPGTGSRDVRISPRRTTRYVRIGPLPRATHNARRVTSRGGYRRRASPKCRMPDRERCRAGDMGQSWSRWPRREGETAERYVLARQRGLGRGV